MPQNSASQSVGRRDSVRLGAVLVVACIVLVSALVIKFAILPNHIKNADSEVLNNETTQDNESNRQTTESSTTHLSAESSSAVEDTEWTISSTFSPNHWIMDSYLITPRGSFAAAVMKNGEILVSGGLGDGPDPQLFSSEIYSPQNRKWRTVTDMEVGRAVHTLTTLQNGKSVLAVGDFDLIDTYTAEIYDLETNRWTFVPTRMDVGRRYHTATLLKNEQVLIAGGTSNSNTQLYDPSSNTFITTGNLNMGRGGHTATPLNDEMSVLVTGGTSDESYRISTAEIYTTGLWSYTTGGMITARSDHAAVLLLDGNVLVAGGLDVNDNVLSSVEIYNVNTGTFSLTQSMACVRWQLTLTRLPSGQILAAGGIGSTTDGCPLVSELYDPTTSQWTSTRLLNSARYDHVAVLINNSVLVIGGYGSDGNSELNQCESCANAQ